MSDEIRSIPLRLDLPSELAAVAIPLQEDEDAVVILNSNEQDLRGTYVELRLRTLIPLLVGWVIGHTKWIRQHQLVTSIVAATSGAVLATGLPPVFKKEEPHEVGSQPSVTVMVTPTPYPPSYASPSHKPARSPHTPHPQQASKEGIPSPPTPPARTSHPSPAKSPRRPSNSSTPTLERTAPAESLTPSDPRPRRTEAPPRHTPTSSTETHAPPSASTEAPSTVSTQDCTLHVDLDPLLDLCVIS